MADPRVMSRIIETGIDKRVWALSKQAFKGLEDETINSREIEGKIKTEIYSWLKENESWFKSNNMTIRDDYFSYLKINKLIGYTSVSRRKKASRVFKKLEEMSSYADLLDMKIYFVTLTWNDDDLQNSYNYRRRQINEFFRQFPMYQCNIDFSPDIDREHYHGVVLTDKKLNKVIDRKSEDNYITEITKMWGRFAKAQPLNHKKINAKSDFRRVSKYLGKIGYHAIKDTTQGLRIVYSTKKHEETMLKPLIESKFEASGYEKMEN